MLRCPIHAKVNAHFTLSPVIYFASSSRRGIRSSMKLDIYIYTYFAEARSSESPIFSIKRACPYRIVNSGRSECRSVIRQCDDVSECNTINRQWTRNVPLSYLTQKSRIKYSQYPFFLLSISRNNVVSISLLRLRSRTRYLRLELM